MRKSKLNQTRPVLGWRGSRRRKENYFKANQWSGALRTYLPHLDGTLRRTVWPANRTLAARSAAFSSSLFEGKRKGGIENMAVA